MPNGIEEYINKQLEKDSTPSQLLLDNIQAPNLEGMAGKEFPQLNHLSLVGCGLETLEGLPELPSCRVVDASENKLKDLQLLVEKCPDLYHLNLCGNAEIKVSCRCTVMISSPSLSTS